MMENPESHFIKRAGVYDCSSQWVKDPVLIDKIKRLSDAGPDDYVLDLAVGTGKIAEAFRGQVRCVVGVDTCWQMAMQAMGRADRIVLARAERLPFKDGMFDICVCRQGLQFMDLDQALLAIHRVLKPGGRVVLCHLTSHGTKDREESFLVQQLRNPARKNFFLPQDFERILKLNNFSDIEFFEYLTVESVNQWTDHGAIDENVRRRIREVYRNASDDFKNIHQLRFADGDIFDTMKMVIVKAVKKGD